MEALSMLKYWRGGGGGGGGSGYADAAAAAIKAAVVREEEGEGEEGEEEEEGNDDEGPFFDLEFAVPDEEEEGVEEEETDGDEREEEEEFDFAVSSAGSSGGDGGGGGGGRDVSLSPSDDLFFKGRLVPLEPAVFAGVGEPGHSKPAAQFPAVSFLKSATKFRVFLLGLKKPRLPPAATAAAKAPEQPSSSPAAAKSPAAGQQGKLFTVKFKVEEVPIVSLFTRDNSSKGSFKPGKAAGGGTPSPADVDGVSDAKRLLGKYLKMIKPLYVRVSRRYAEKLKLEQAAEPQPPPPSSPPPPPSAPPAAATGTKSNSNVSLPAGLRVVCKHLGKSRSASSAAVLPASAANAGVAGGQMSSQRRDDSLLQQQDGIQSAILHCKRSLNASSLEAVGAAEKAPARCTGGHR